MAEPEDTIGLPDIIRNANRPIIIYQGPPPGQFDPITSNALGLLAWLSVLTICLALIALSFWTIWNPGHDENQYSPIYAEGRPAGLAGRVAERRQINEQAGGLLDYVQRLQADNYDRRRTSETHALITGSQGVDALRREWDAECARIRARLYDRRIGEIDTRISDVRRRLRQAGDAETRTALAENLTGLQTQRRAAADQRRTDSDPALRCTPAAQAPVCANDAGDPWCNPQSALPGEFAAGRS